MIPIYEYDFKYNLYTDILSVCRISFDSKMVLDLIVKPMI